MQTYRFPDNYVPMKTCSCCKKTVLNGTCEELADLPLCPKCRPMIKKILQTVCDAWSFQNTIVDEITEMCKDVTLF